MHSLSDCGICHHQGCLFLFLGLGTFHDIEWIRNEDSGEACNRSRDDRIVVGDAHLMASEVRNVTQLNE